MAQLYTLRMQIQVRARVGIEVWWVKVAVHSRSTTRVVGVGGELDGAAQGAFDEGGCQSIGQINTDCDGTIPRNAATGVQEWSTTSYREDFNLQGGGMFVTKWDENRIAVWSFFRAAVPADIVRGTPNPYTMGFTLVAALEPGRLVIR
ncbi:hypothetical protein K435DRAFT_962432 [Dendrothele bispora CBS 962.96]|uniref:Uncharacterized protein n=1 Tax=Dendrothele bispora (strain CBS 962.96) TaxID=1314807 RepID=A0A4S8MLA2_DENBC|nr:hypothetical protein K435DRAFT_962432 [Dendrothele bispora CBS 962.96]